MPRKTKKEHKLSTILKKENLNFGRGMGKRSSEMNADWQILAGVEKLREGRGGASGVWTTSQGTEKHGAGKTMKKGNT